MVLRIEKGGQGALQTPPHHQLPFRKHLGGLLHNICANKTNHFELLSIAMQIVLLR
jgi:hypothetical protein